MLITLYIISHSSVSPFHTFQGFYLTHPRSNVQSLYWNWYDGGTCGLVSMEIIIMRTSCTKCL